jgi:hypothetical protein
MARAGVAAREAFLEINDHQRAAAPGALGEDDQVAAAGKKGGLPLPPPCRQCAYAALCGRAFHEGDDR